MKYFGTDGIRGSTETLLTESFAYKVGLAIALVVDEDEVIIGMDTRASGPVLAKAIASGFTSTGKNATLAGVVTTPALAHYAKQEQILGIMITASHNPYQDNGIKVFYQGEKLSETLEREIEARIDYSPEINHLRGYTRETEEVITTYAKLFGMVETHTSKFQVILDSANGANSLFAKDLIEPYAKTVFAIANMPDGMNINQGVGSTHIEYLKNALKEAHISLGFAYDGDGDRVNFVYQDQLFDGDLIVYIIAKYLKNKNELPNHGVVLTKMSNPGLLKALHAQGIDYALSDVGDKNVFDLMKQKGYMVGGESSGHILLPNLIHSGDGLLTTAFLLSILNELDTDPITYTKEVELYPIKTTSIKVADRSILENKDFIHYIEGIQQVLGDNALLLLRKSGTEPLIRLTISHKDDRLVERLTQNIVKYILKEGELHE